ncbi:RNA polymerase factor sigma-54 [Bartonella sp. HY761]|uniref:RNA polymerase factor sigma-54 n=1 Tax=Bartonella sp. HY761 TaxID=2979330 RepID=UPI0021FC0D0B|nr:RNA polymerase factor sigma-54 [Bartonella sp. HY761]UXN06612.1 RNA polymerase factor sigma-54 [Bartonella sp. HY761]
MALSAELHLRHSQQLVMTSQLVQSIKLLAMTGIELERFINEEIERNPLLDLVNKNDNDIKDTRPNSDETPSLTTEELQKSAFSQSEHIATDSAVINDNIYDSAPRIEDPKQPDIRADFRLKDSANSNIDDFAQFISAPISLRAHIDEQILYSFHDSVDRFIARDLADQIDESGYFIGDLEETALRLNQSIARIENILNRLQGFDPIGIFAKDLAGCLTLQLKDKNRYDPAMAKLLTHLEDLAKRDFVKLKRICGVDEEDLIDMLGEIRALDPKPGLAFSSSPTDIIVPDVFITHIGDDFRVELNPHLLPKILINENYSNIVCRDKTDQEFLSNALQSANWLLKALDQRANTLLLVVSEIVRQQQGFLRHGISHLKPLSMTALAEKIGIHESTISRVTTNKYVATPRGTLDLRFFFTTAIAAADGSEAYSSESVRHRIRQLIQDEPANAILSDDNLVDLLKKEGMDIARRTVAKYREAMNIPSSVARRREKKARILSTKA